MKKGKILQVGTPLELYTYPKHVFVANFIGENNFLESAWLRSTVSFRMILHLLSHRKAQLG
jgi:ABC-type Fe3+/spermidine/putrescine transport system ATPase subunit